MSSPSTAVITGTGAVCAAGATVDGIWQKLAAGSPAIGRVEGWEFEGWPAPLAGEVAETNRALVPDRKLHKSIARTDMYGLYTADAAVRQSGLLEHRGSLAEDAVAEWNDRSGVIAGSGGGELGSNYDYLPLLAETGADLPEFGRQLDSMVSPMWLLRNLPNNVLCHVGIRYQFKGYNACITNHCASGSLSVAESLEAIRHGEAERMLAVGHDAPVDPESMLHHHRAGLVSARGLQPFEAGRDGTVFGDGAACVVLESRRSAEARGATILGEVLGSGCVTEGIGLLDLRPDGDGVARAVAMALADAGVTAGEIGMICAHGNGTPASDATEVRGLRTVFGDDLPPVTGFKWAFGHLVAASGIIDLVLALEALRRGIVPGIGTLRTPDPALGVLPVSSSAQEPAGPVALTICRGFGGMNVALVIRAATG